VEPFSLLAVWRQSSMGARLALAAAVAVFLLGATGPLENPVLKFCVMAAAAVSVIAGPVVLGIATGVRLVAARRKAVANGLGIGLIVAGGLVFGWAAGRNKDGLWEHMAGGTTIGPALTFLGLGVLLFGLGMFMRHARKSQFD
jgi:hypothetical protein